MSDTMPTNKTKEDAVIEHLVKLSKEMCDKAYCPYSKFPVGAALLCEDGKIFTGCNVENAAFSLSNCAERTAVFKAVSEGYIKFKAIAIASLKTNDFIWPCGACRQVLNEFSSDLEIIVSKGDDFKKTTINHLLPHGFTSDDLKLN